MYKQTYEAYKTEIIFLHIPKNAGSSFKKSFNKDMKTLPHCKSVPQKNKINIAIIRHPESRLLSIFGHIKQKDTWNTDWVQDNNTSYELRNFSTIEDLCNAYYDNEHPHHQTARHIFEWENEKLENFSGKACVWGCREDKCIHWAPQSKFIPNAVDVDYLLRLENLNNDIKFLHEKGILQSDTIEQVNETNKNFYPELSPIVLKLCKEIYKDDYSLWEKSGLRFN
jgi:hypothetical protein